MHTTNRSALASARSLIEVIRNSRSLGLAERNTAMAERYIALLLDCGLIDRPQFEELTVEAEMAFSRWLAETDIDQVLV